MLFITGRLYRLTHRLPVDIGKENQNFFLIKKNREIQTKELSLAHCCSLLFTCTCLVVAVSEFSSSVLREGLRL